MQRYGAATIEVRLHDLSMYNYEPHQQRAMLDAAQSFTQHAARMGYPSNEQFGVGRSAAV